MDYRHSRHSLLTHECRLDTAFENSKHDGLLEVGESSHRLGKKSAFADDGALDPGPSFDLQLLLHRYYFQHNVASIGRNTTLRSRKRLWPLSLIEPECAH